MVDFLKRSVRDLEAPECSDCGTQMLWFRSMRMSMKEEAITHVFQCPNCNRLIEVKNKKNNNGNPKNGPQSRAAA